MVQVEFCFHETLNCLWTFTTQLPTAKRHWILYIPMAGYHHPSNSI